MLSFNWIHPSCGRCLLLRIFLTALLCYKSSEAHTYSWPLPTGFNEGDMATVKGSLPVGGSIFSINFMGGPEMLKSDIIFHMDNRYASDQIVINTKDIDANWLNEEIYKDSGALVGGRHFTVIIVLKGDQFMITTNGRHFITFKVRKSNSYIKYLYITG
ncbi:hypothetical protein AMK59_4513, partial [Oryctes borbonicus]